MKNSALIKQITTKREQLGLTLDDLGKAIGVHPVTLSSQLKSGELVPRVLLKLEAWIAGRPALYWPGEQICFCNRYQRNAPPLATSLRQIRKEQRASVEWRKARGWSGEGMEYGYVVVGAP